MKWTALLVLGLMTGTVWGKDYHGTWEICQKESESSSYSYVLDLGTHGHMTEFYNYFGTPDCKNDLKWEFVIDSDYGVTKNQIWGVVTDIKVRIKSADLAKGFNKNNFCKRNDWQPNKLIACLDKSEDFRGKTLGGTRYVAFEIFNNEMILSNPETGEDAMTLKYDNYFDRIPGKRSLKK